MWEHFLRLQDLKPMQSPRRGGKRGAGMAPRNLEKVMDYTLWGRSARSAVPYSCRGIKELTEVGMPEWIH